MWHAGAQSQKLKQAGLLGAPGPLERAGAAPASSALLPNGLAGAAKMGPSRAPALNPYAAQHQHMLQQYQLSVMQSGMNPFMHPHMMLPPGRASLRSASHFPPCVLSIMQLSTFPSLRLRVAGGMDCGMIHGSMEYHPGIVLIALGERLRCEIAMLCGDIRAI